MNKNAIFFAAVAALSSGVAMAQTNDYRGERHDQNRYEQGQRGEDRNAYARQGGDSQRGEHRDYRDNRDNRDNDGYRDRRDNRDYRQNRDFRRHDGYGVYNNGSSGHYVRNDFRRGGYVPSEYRGSRYAVSDWRSHRGLYAPQRGYQWVQSGNDYLLVAIATGLIANVLLNN